MTTDGFKIRCAAPHCRRWAMHEGTYCKPCFDRRFPPPKPTQEPVKAVEPQSECKHLSWYTGPDEVIARLVPGFFSERKEAGLGHEWHYCRDCGFVKCVDLVWSLGLKGPITPARWPYTESAA